MYLAGAVRALGFFIPDYRCRALEISEDTNYTEHLDHQTQPLQTGDIIGFTRVGETDMKQAHLGIIRMHPHTQEIDIVHATRLTGKVEATSIENIMRESQYATIAFVKRPTFPLQGLINPQAQENLGFWTMQRTRRSLTSE